MVGRWHTKANRVATRAPVEPEQGQRTMDWLRAWEYSDRPYLRTPMPGGYG